MKSFCFLSSLQEHPIQAKWMQPMPSSKSKKKLEKNWNASFVSKFRGKRLKFSPAWNNTYFVCIAPNSNWSLALSVNKTSSMIRSQGIVWQKKWFFIFSNKHKNRLKRITISTCIRTETFNNSFFEILSLSLSVCLSLKTVVCCKSFQSLKSFFESQFFFFN